MQPETRYARSGDVNIAYQVVGDGPLDLVSCRAWSRTSSTTGRTARVARFLRRLASFSRLILFDKRGTGLSDRVRRRAPDARGADGRRPGGDGRGRLGAGGAVRRLRGRADVRCSSPRPIPSGRGADPLRRRTRRRALGAGLPRGVDRGASRRAFVERIERGLGQRARRDLGAQLAERSRRSPAVVRDYLRLAASPGAALALLRMNFEIDVRARPADDPRPDAGPAPDRRPAGRTSGGAPLPGRAHPRRAVRRAARRRPSAWCSATRTRSSTRSRSS